MQILVVDDDEIYRSFISETLSNMGYGVVEAKNGIEALSILQSNPINFVICDWMMPEMDGIETAGIIRSRFDIPSIFVTAYADDKLLERAKITEPFGYTIKLFENRELHSNIEMALYKHRVEKERKKLITEQQD